MSLITTTPSDAGSSADMLTSTRSDGGTRRTAPAWAWTALLGMSAVWLVFCWTVLRVEPTDIADWAGSAVLLGALSVGLRTLRGGQMWSLHAGLAALFAVTGAVILMDGDASLATPAALVGWYLLVHGAVDIVTATMSRGTEAAWALMLAIGTAELALGFWASSSFSRTPDVLILMVGGLALARGVADLTTAFGMRPATSTDATAPAATAGGMVTAAGMASTVQSAGASGYAAGMTDVTLATSARPSRARHRAPSDDAATAPTIPTTTVRETVQSHANLDAMLTLAGMSGATMGPTDRSATAPVSPAMMFTAPDVSAVGDATLPGADRMPAGPPMGMSGDAPLTRASVQAAQAHVVQISPTTAAVAARTDATSAITTDPATD